MMKMFDKIVIFFMLSGLFISCSKQKDSSMDIIDRHCSWMTCLSDDGMTLAEKMHLADSLIEDSFAEIEDSVAEFILSSNKISEQCSDELPWKLVTSEDKKVVLLTIPGGGTMITGTSYLRYQKKDGSYSIKKVAYPQEDPEGGVNFPAFFNEVHVTPDGYVLYGVFSFGNQEVCHKDTLAITTDFLESDLNGQIS